MTTPTPNQATPDDTRAGSTETTPLKDHLIRSEERLHVSTRRVPSGRARLEKYVVTETRTITVEVSHEEVRLIHLDHSGDANDVDQGSAQSGADVDDRSLILSEEQIVVTKMVVPVERVQLRRTAVTENRVVTELVRSERIEEDPTKTPRSTAQRNA